MTSQDKLSRYEQKKPEPPLAQTRKITKKESLRQKSLSLIKEELEKFLTRGGKIEGYDQISNSVSLSEEQAKEFLNYMDCSAGKFPFINRQADPREDVYRGNGGKSITAEYLADNTVYIWNKPKRSAEFE